MRIIAGEYGSRKIETRKSNDTRPTLDKVREAVFSSLGGYFDGGRFLDLYAGSGANGLEAISRGMDESYFVDCSRDAITCINNNIKSLKCESKCHVLSMKDVKALSVLKSKGLKFDIIYLDPPYAHQENNKIMSIIMNDNLLNDNGYVIIESLKEDEYEKEINGLKLIKEKVYGISKISYYKYEVNE